MTKKIHLVFLFPFLFAAAVFPSGDEFKCIVTSTDMAAFSWGEAQINFEFRSGGRVLVRMTPTSYEPHDEVLTTIPAEDIDLLISKPLDKASAHLLQAMKSRTIFPTVELALMGTVGDKELRVTYRLSDVLVRRITPTEGGEMLSLNFAKIEVE